MKIHWQAGSGQPDQRAEAVVLLVSPDDLDKGGIHPSADAALAALRERHLFDGSLLKTYVLPVLENGSRQTLILIGRGDQPLTGEELRLAGIKAAKEVLRIQASIVAFRVPSTVMNYTVEQGNRAAAQALTEGILLGLYRRSTYKQNAASVIEPDELFYYPSGITDEQTVQEWEKGIELGIAFGEATRYARDLINIPGNLLVPQTLADQAVQLAEKYGFESHVLNEEEITEKGMGALTAVGQGSIHPPRMIVIKYQGREAWEDVIGLIGKGITFDTGGISIKPALNMENMISDMGGAAAVLGVMDALGRLRPAINVVMVIPSAENMPAHNAFKPGDVITSMSGRTIEITNTDAEGRLVLADGITYAKALGAERLVDVATLTGAVLVLLGDVASGILTNDETFSQGMISASKRTGEKLWPLPVYEEFRDMLKSDHADLKNNAGRYGASSTGGLFIEAFTDGTPWVHLDIAGTAYLTKERGVNPKGGTGVMVRTLVEWLLSEVEYPAG
ncbi:leucyl aminopeptidase [Paenibacillus sp. JX-17]|uniref:Probable cytosol aminopeptidase n=1 Tax=Paenibacillus lacisoli TaxID=3064525 RepID=A0ABT9CDR1_9BACL|nr:leucyl aminopeptidase [Paenibacillus sp. JX-17]MDO7907415.1 leucyl aminopeptidase [Paenibacillus sp. JX-17]